MGQSFLSCKESLLAITLACLGGVTSTALAANPTVPQELSVQGVLRDNAGGLQSGVFGFTVNIYTTQVGGTAIWTESQALTAVSVESGFFTLVLTTGDAPQFSGASIGNVVENAVGTALYIGVQVAGDTSELPRIPMTAVPYAFLSDQAITAQNIGTVSSTAIESVFGGASVCGTGQAIQSINSNGSVTCATAGGGGGGTTYTGTSPIVVGSGANPAISLSGCTNSGQVLTWSTTSSTWSCAYPSTYAMPAGASGGVMVTNGASPLITLATCPSGEVLMAGATANSWTCVNPLASLGTATACGPSTFAQSYNAATNKWTCGTPTAYTTGNGVTVSGTDQLNLTAAGSTCSTTTQFMSGFQASGAIDCAPLGPSSCAAGNYVSGYDPGNGVSCTVVPAQTTYSAGTKATGTNTTGGLQLNSGAFTLNNCTMGDVLVAQSTAGEWACGSAGTTYTGASGVTVAGSLITANPDEATITNAAGQLAVNNIGSPCGSGQFVTSIAGGTTSCGTASAATVSGASGVSVNGSGLVTLANPITTPVTINGGSGSLSVGPSGAAAGQVDFKGASVGLPITRVVSTSACTGCAGGASCATGFACCPSGTVVISGGCDVTASGANDHMSKNCPATAANTCAGATTPTGWACEDGSAGAQTAYVICLTGF